MTTCHVTVYPTLDSDHFAVRGTACNQPVVGEHGLCAKHEADRVRLGGGT